MHELELIYTLTLKCLQGVGTTKIQNILKNLQFQPSNLTELYESINPFIRLNQSDLDTAFRRAEKILEESNINNIKVISIGDKQFPQQLKTIAKPPIILYVKGDIEYLKPEKSVAIIGTRQPTNYGKKVGERISKKIVEEFGLTIVSGLAIGCDTAAHEGCLQAEGRTVAVLAHGLHKIYPAENRDLARRILDLGGCLVSEYPLGHEVFKNQFVERDRIQSGLSSAVVVIETDIKSGTMHTVNSCIEQGRKLACINYPLEHRSDKSRGNEKLISEGKAIPIWDKVEIEKFVVSTFGQIVEPSRNSSLIKSDKVNENVSLIQSKVKSLEEQPLEPKPLLVNKIIPEQLISKITNDDLEDDFIKLEIKINKKEYELLEAKCLTKKQKPLQVIHELLKQYLIDEYGKNAGYKTKLNNGYQQGSFHKQLTIIPHFDEDLIDENITINLEEAKTLNQEDLAKRLKVSPSTIRKYKQKDCDFFRNWSRSKDPEGIAWEYSDKNKLFEIAF